jgi:hypothetical protein
MLNFDLINNLITSADSLLHPTDNTINVVAYKEREAFIKKLKQYKAEIAEFTNYLSKTIETAESIRDTELSLMTKIIDHNTPPKREATVAQTAQHTLTVPHVNNINVNNVQHTAPIIHPEPIKITDTLQIMAKRVTSFDKVKQDGDIYYITKNKHFAIKIAGVLYHGNIGKIFSSDKNPEKIKDCRFGITCVKYDSCMYYHDPLQYPVSSDIRNFVAQSWVYSDPSNRNNPMMRKFGALQNLETDAMGVQVNDLSRYDDQIMHDLLCSALLHNLKINKK